MKTNNNFDSFSTKRVSYIISTKNRAAYLEKAFKKCRKLIGKDDQLIIADGGSTDRTKSIVKRYQDLVDIFICENDKNPTHALNKGILLAQGRYIKNLNDDDIIYPEHMEKAIRIMDKHTEIDLLICGGMKEFKEKSWPFYVPEGVDYGGSFENIFKYGVCGVGFIIRRKSLALGGLFPPVLISDSSFVLEFIAKGMTVKFCRIDLFTHPILSHSFINTRSVEVQKEVEELMKSFCGWKFWLDYKIKQFINIAVDRYPIIKIFLVPFILNKKRGFPAKSNMIWDGGFS